MPGGAPIFPIFLDFLRGGAPIFRPDFPLTWIPIGCKLLNNSCKISEIPATGWEDEAISASHSFRSFFPGGDEDRRGGHPCASRHHELFCRACRIHRHQHWFQRRKRKHRRMAWVGRVGISSWRRPPARCHPLGGCRGSASAKRSDYRVQPSRRPIVRNDTHRTGPRRTHPRLRACIASLARPN